jgi:hypothetical protein
LLLFLTWLSSRRREMTIIMNKIEKRRRRRCTVWCTTFSVAAAIKRIFTPPPVPLVVHQSSSKWSQSIRLYTSAAQDEKVWRKYRKCPPMQAAPLRSKRELDRFIKFFVFYIVHCSNEMMIQYRCLFQKCLY